MSTIKIETSQHGIKWINVNGKRVEIASRIGEIRQTGDSSWTLTDKHWGRDYEVFGGRRAGGSSRDWFLASPEWDNPILCKSAAEAVRIIESM